MKISDKLFVITLTDATEKKFVGIDQLSGGELYWAGSLAGAKFFGSEDEAKMMLQYPEFTENSVMCDGTKRPPRMIDCGLGLCNTKTFGEGFIKIDRIDFSVAHSENVSGKIEKPKEVKYIY